jgi:hypothetical protein
MHDASWSVFLKPVDIHIASTDTQSRQNVLRGDASSWIGLMWTNSGITYDQDCGLLFR